MTKMDNSETLEIVHKWVTRTLESKKWSARHWASISGVSPSTLQRFRAEKAWVLSATVITRLSATAGSFPDIGMLNMGAPEGVSRMVPVKRIEGRNILDTNTKRSVNLEKNESDDTFVVPVQSDHMTSRGFFFGDFIVIDPNKKAKEGQVVLTRTRDGIFLYEIQGEFLIPRSSAPHQPVHVDEAEVLGVATKLVRDIH